MFILGYGVKKDYKEAEYWYRKAAEQNHPWAQFNLGNIYSEGKGVTQNTTEAIYWYKKSARQGIEPAQKELSKLGETW